MYPNFHTFAHPTAYRDLTKMLSSKHGLHPDKTQFSTFGSETSWIGEILHEASLANCLSRECIRKALSRHALNESGGWSYLTCLHSAKPGLEAIKLFICSTQRTCSMKFHLLKKMMKNNDFSCFHSFKLSDVVLSC